MAHFLLLDTATDICSVALASETEVLAARQTDTFSDHGRMITQFIAQCLEEAGFGMDALDAIAVSAGPGSFTGLRIGVGTAKGLCFGLSIPLIAVDTLTALAQAAIQEGDPADTCYIPMLDARSMGVYYAIFDRQLQYLQALKRGKVQEQDLPIDRAVVCCGGAAEKFRKVLDTPKITYRPQHHQAAFLLPLARQAWQQQEFQDLAYFEPNYVAPPNITTPRKKT